MKCLTLLLDLEYSLDPKKLAQLLKMDPKFFYSNFHHIILLSYVINQ